MQVTSHHLGSVTSRSVAKFPSLVGWHFLFCSVFKGKESYIVCIAITVCPFCLPAPFSPLNIFNLSYERVKHFTCPWACSIRSQQRHLNDPVEILSVTSLLQSHLHSHKIWPEWKIAAMRWWPAASVWLQQAIKYDPCVSDDPSSSSSHFTWKYEFMCIKTMPYCR